MYAPRDVAGSPRDSEATTLPTRRSSEALRLPSRTDMSTIRVVFVDDEAANCRLGLRMLLKLGVLRENITFLTNGAWLCAQPVSVLSLNVGQVVECCCLALHSVLPFSLVNMPAALPPPCVCVGQALKPTSSLRAAPQRTSCCWTFACPSSPGQMSCATVQISYPPILWYAMC